MAQVPSDDQNIPPKKPKDFLPQFLKSSFEFVSEMFNITEEWRVSTNEYYELNKNKKNVFDQIQKFVILYNKRAKSFNKYKKNFQKAPQEVFKINLPPGINKNDVENLDYHEYFKSVLNDIRKDDFKTKSNFNRDVRNKVDANPDLTYREIEDDCKKVQLSFYKYMIRRRNKMVNLLEKTFSTYLDSKEKNTENKEDD